MKNNVTKNAIMLYGLSISKIIFPLLTLPYLTRVLSVEGYGLVTYVKSVMQYMQIVVDFGFMLSGTKDIIEIKDDKKALGDVTGNILLARAVLALISFVVLLLMTCWIKLLKSHILFTVLSYIPVFLSIFLCDYLFRGLEQMQIITVRFIVMKGIAVAWTFFCVKSDSDILLIPIFDIIGTIIAIILVLKSIGNMKVKIRLGKLRNAIRRLGESAVFFASNMATTAFGALNTVLIGAYLPTIEVAYWGVCMQMIGAIQTMYNPIIDGVYPEMIKSKNVYLIKKVLLIFMPVIVLGCSFSYLIAPIALRIVGGEQYIAATSLFRLLLPVLLFSFPGMLLGWPTLGAFNHQKDVTMSTIIAAVFQVLGIVLLIFTNNFSIYSLAVLRGITEFVLMLIRYYYFKINRGIFVYR